MGATAAFFFALTRLFPRLPFGGRALVRRRAGAARVRPPRAARPRRRDGPARAGRHGPETGRSGGLRPGGGPAPEAADVVSEGGFVEAGTSVEVVRVEGTRVVVRPVTPSGAPGATP